MKEVCEKLKWDPNCFNQAKCSQGNQCKQICMSHFCNKVAVVCGDKNCSCIKDHNPDVICSWGYPDKIVSLVEKKRWVTPGQIEFVENLFQRFIDEVLRKKQSIIQQLDYMGLTKAEQQFLEISYRHEFDKLNGKFVNTIVNGINQQRNKVQRQQESIKRLIQREFHRICDPFIGELPKLSKFINDLTQNKLKEEAQLINTAEKMTIDSHIIKTNEQKIILYDLFLPNKKLKQFKLLYRASENDFLTQHFHQKCDGISHTLTLIKTVANKTIGGYTPQAWYKSQNGKPTPDNSCQSFVFSISENAKFNMVPEKQQYAIMQYYSTGPVFGHGNEMDNDFKIADQANSNQNSFSNIGNVYTNPYYTQNTKHTQQKILGESSPKFSTAEWEVFQVSFQ